jgi:hypothetical protein
MKLSLLAAACWIMVPVATLAQERALDFDLECTAKTAEGAVEAPPRSFHIQITAEGQATVIDKNAPPPANEETHTYVNAYLWRADGVDNFFDRIKGTLTTKPRTFTWHCQKVGGQKF